MSDNNATSTDDLSSKENLEKDENISELDGTIKKIDNENVLDETSKNLVDNDKCKSDSETNVPYENNENVDSKDSTQPDTKNNFDKSGVFYEGEKCVYVDSNTKCRYIWDNNKKDWVAENQSNDYAFDGTTYTYVDKNTSKSKLIFIL